MNRDASDGRRRDLAGDVGAGLAAAVVAAVVTGGGGGGGASPGVAGAVGLGEPAGPADLAAPYGSLTMADVAAFLGYFRGQDPDPSTPDPVLVLPHRTEFMLMEVPEGWRAHLVHAADGQAWFPLWQGAGEPPPRSAP